MKIYNGLQSELMDEVCRILFLHMDLKEIKNWETVSLYLARTCNYLEKIGWKKENKEK